MSFVQYEGEDWQLFKVSEPMNSNTSAIRRFGKGKEQNPERTAVLSIQTSNIEPIGNARKQLPRLEHQPVPPKVLKKAKEEEQDQLNVLTTETADVITAGAGDQIILSHH